MAKMVEHAIGLALAVAPPELTRYVASCETASGKPPKPQRTHEWVSVEQQSEARRTVGGHVVMLASEVSRMSTQIVCLTDRETELQNDCNRRENEARAARERGRQLEARLAQLEATNTMLRRDALALTRERKGCTCNDTGLCGFCIAAAAIVFDSGDALGDAGAS